MNKEIENVLKKITKSGFKSYLVGGYVRDYLLGLKSVDVDIATSANPSDLIKIFPDAKIDSNYGSIKFSTQHYKFDITTFREEIYNNDKLETNYVDDLYIDALRRDFTINSIYMDFRGNIIDPYNGVKDLKNKILKMIGNANLRYKEDPLRILRTIRLKTQLGFNVEKTTIEALEKHKFLLKKISYFRKKEELNKMFISQNKLEGLELLKQYNLHELLDIEYNKVKFTTDPLGIWAQINFNEYYPFTKQEKNIIKKLRNFTSLTNENIYKNGLYISLIASEILGFDKLEVNIIYKNLPIKDRKDIKINYKKLINLGYKDNEINGIIKMLEAEILNGNLKNNRKSIIKYFNSRK